MFYSHGDLTYDVLVSARSLGAAKVTANPVASSFLGERTIRLSCNDHLAVAVQQDNPQTSTMTADNEIKT